MSQFKVVPVIESFGTWGAFCDAFSVGHGDLLITDRVIYENYLKQTSFDAVIIQDDYGQGEPSDEKITAIRTAAQKAVYTRVIAVGGGTVVDIGKLLATDGWDDCLKLFKKECRPTRTKKLVIIPTTCGTGSEVTNISVASFPSLHTKIGLATDELYADHAVLIGELIASLPLKVFMHSSIDALIHAVESYLSPKANALTKMFSERAIRIITDGYRTMAQNGTDSRRDLLDAFLLAANCAGIAFSNAGCGLIHAMSYPIGGTYHLPHGESNYEVMMAALRFYEANKYDGHFDALLQLTGSLAETEALIEQLMPRRKMASFGMTDAQAEAFSADVIKNQQRLLANCYILPDAAQMADIYRNIL